MMRTSTSVFLVCSALVACSLAAPVLDRRVRQTSTSDLLDTMSSGLRILSKYSKWRMAQSLNVSNCSYLDMSDSEPTGPPKTLQTALNVACRLYEANRIVPNINLPDQTTQEVLQVMSEKGVQDACLWLNETLTSSEIGSSGLPSDVNCSNVSSLSGICGQWSEYKSILTIESKVKLLNPSINETLWFSGHTDLDSADYQRSGC